MADLESGQALYDEIAAFIDEHYEEPAWSQAPASADVALSGAYAPSPMPGSASAPAPMSKRTAASAPVTVPDHAPLPAHKPLPRKRRRGPLSALGDALSELRELRESRVEKTETAERLAPPSGDDEAICPDSKVDHESHSVSKISYDAAPSVPALGYDAAYSAPPTDYDAAYSAPAPSASFGAGSLASADGGRRSGSLQDWLDNMDAPFSTTLLELIDESGMTDAQVYKRANMSRQLFSKIRSDAAYRPAKKTVLALALALGLNLVQTQDLLRRAGFALSNSSKSDLIVKYFIINGDHDIMKLNDMLYRFDQPTL